MSEYFRLYFRDTDGYLAYVTDVKSVRPELPAFYRFTAFTTDISKSAGFDEESCAVIKKKLEEYYNSMMPAPLHLTADRIL
jgi:hypothetical protein